MRDTIFYVGGSKGGVGKSFVSLALVQYLIDKFGDTKTIHLIETDPSNPDVGRVYDKKIPITKLILDEEAKGWLKMSETIEQSQNTLFVVNSAALSNMGVAKNGSVFSRVLEQGKIAYDLVTLWPMNRQADSVLLLNDFLKSVTLGLVFPIRNTHFGTPDQFSRFTKYYKEFELLQTRVAQVLDLPELIDEIVDEFYGHTIPDTMNLLGAFASVAFETWRNQVYDMFDLMMSLIADNTAQTVDPTESAEPVEDAKSSRGKKGGKSGNSTEGA